MSPGRPSSGDLGPLSQKHLAQALGLTTRQIRNLEEKGIPHWAEGNRKCYPVPEAVEWYIERKVSEALEGAEVTDYEAARARRETARARLAEIEVAREEGGLLPREVVDDVYGEMLDVLRATILNMPGRWGAQMGFSSPRKGEARLKVVARELLEHLSGDVADRLEEEGEGGAHLPEDFPGRAHLEEAGIETLSDLLGVDDLQSIRGIGPVTERRIQEALVAGA